MKAYRILTQTTIEPFNRSVLDCSVLNKPLASLQEEILEQAGFSLVSEPPADEDYLIFTDRMYFSLTLLEKIKSGGQGQLVCRNEKWNQNMSSVLSAKDGKYELAVLKGEPSFIGLEALEIDWELREADEMKVHIAMRHALRPMMVGASLAFSIGHWVDLIRANQLAILEKAERIRYQWKHNGLWFRVALLFHYLFKIRSINAQKIARRIGTEGKNCKIHPTAIIEACEIGDNVEIGPYSIIRASVIGDGAKIEEHVTMNFSVMGRNTRLNRYSMLNLSVLLEDALVSYGGGFQMCLFGRGCFVAIGATMIDMSFGKTIKIAHQGKRIDSGQHFLGACIGERARVGNGVRLSYGTTIPNDAFLVGGLDELIIDASDALPNEPVKAEAGKVVSARRRK